MRWQLAFLLFSISGFAQTDGPATLPQTTMATTMASTPSPNGSKAVGPLDSLPAALKGAQCGDLILVDPANVTVGGVTLPTLACDSQHWITIQNSGLTVIDEFHRIHPGIPMPKIILNASNAAIRGGAFVRLVGFEVTRTVGSGIVSNLILPGASAHDLIFDRNYVHGTSIDETTRGLMLNNTTNVAVINSWFSDFHCMATVGSCTDAQAIAGGGSAQQDGNYLVQNNYLEASGENFILGGSAATFVPQDVTIQYNDFAKLDSWNPADPTYSAVNGKDGLPHPWITKNLIELKNCRRCLIQGNRLIGSWGGFTQVGSVLLLTPKNQGNLCPICAVEDVTFRYNRASKAGQALQLGCGPSDSGGWPAGCGWWSIHDNTFDGLQYVACYGCSVYLNQLSSAYLATGVPLALHDVTVDRNTFLIDGWLGPGGFLVFGGPPAGMPQATNIRWTNNVQPAGKYSLFTMGGQGNCSTGKMTNFAAAIAACWTGNSAFTGNVIVNSGVGTYPPGNYPVGAGSDLGAVQNALANRKP